MIVFAHYRASIMGLLWIFALTVPLMAYQSQTFSWSIGNDGRTAASNAFSQQSSYNTNSMTIGGSSSSNWPSSSFSESTKDEALDDKYSWKVLSVTIDLPGAGRDDIRVLVQPADRNHPNPSISVRARRGEWEFSKNIDLIGIDENDDLPRVNQQFDVDGRLTLTVKFKVLRDEGESFDQNAFGQSQSASSFNSFGGAAFRPPRLPQLPDMDNMFQSKFFKNSGAGFGNFNDDFDPI